MAKFALLILIALLASGCAVVPMPSTGFAASNDVSEHATAAKSEILAAMIDTGTAGQGHLHSAIKLLDTVVTKDVPAVNANIKAGYADRDAWKTKCETIMGWWLPYWMHQLGFIVLALVIGGLLIFGVVMLVLFFTAEPWFWTIFHWCTAFIFRGIAKVKEARGNAKTQAAQAKAASETAHVQIAEIHAATIEQVPPT